MDLYMVVLRLIHIFAGIFWVGSAFFVTFLIGPTMRAVGPGGQPFMRGFYRHSRFLQAMPIASLLTTVAGVLLYFKVSDTFNSDWLGSNAGIVLTIGSVAGLLAFGHGLTVIGPTSKRVASLIEQTSAQDGPPSDAQMAELRGLQARLGRNGQIVVVLMIISVAGMAAARYL